MCRLCDIAHKLSTYACISCYLQYNTSKYSSISMEDESMMKNSKIVVKRTLYLSTRNICDRYFDK